MRSSHTVVKLIGKPQKEIRTSERESVNFDIPLSYDQFSDGQEKLKMKMISTSIIALYLQI